MHVSWFAESPRPNLSAMIFRCARMGSTWGMSSAVFATTRWMPPVLVLLKMWVVAPTSKGITSALRSRTASSRVGPSARQTDCRDHQAQGRRHRRNENIHGLDFPSTLDLTRRAYESSARRHSSETKPSDSSLKCARAGIEPAMGSPKGFSYSLRLSPLRARARIWSLDFTFTLSRRAI